MAMPAWFCGIAVPPGVVGLSFGPANFAWVFVAVIGLPMLLFVGSYIYWAVTDPDRLGSEAFLERTHMMRIVEASKDPALLSTTTDAPPELGPDPNAPTTKTKALEP